MLKIPSEGLKLNKGEWFNGFHSLEEQLQKNKILPLKNQQVLE
jgi:hypothetical protein